MDDVYFSTYIRQMDEKNQLSGADVVYAISAIIEYPKSVAKMLKPVEGEEEIEGHAQEISRENFWTAYECLRFSELKTLDFGIELAKKTQQAILNQASALIQEKKLKSTQVF
jgi:hypothetical protein